MDRMLALLRCRKPWVQHHMKRGSVVHVHNPRLPEGGEAGIKGYPWLRAALAPGDLEDTEDDISVNTCKLIISVVKRGLDAFYEKVGDSEGREHISAWH